MDTNLPNSPWPAQMEEQTGMRDANSILSAIQAQGNNAWQKIKQNPKAATPGDIQTLSIMMGQGLGDMEGDEWKAAGALVKSHQGPTLNKAEYNNFLSLLSRVGKGKK